MPQVSQKRSKHFASVQVCRGLAAILVVLGHLHGTEIKRTSTNLMRLFDHGALGVDMFFVISGFVIASVTTGKFHNARNACIFLYHRLTRIYPLLWIFTTLALLAYFLLPVVTRSGWPHPVSVLSSYSLLPTHRSMLLLQAWTLSYELYFYLVFFLLLLFLHERAARWTLTLWGIAIILLKLWIGLPSSPLLQLLISPTVLEFLAGCLLAYLNRTVRLHRAAGPLLLLASSILLTGIIVYSIHVHSGQANWIADNPWLRPSFYGTFSTLFLYAAIELERTGLIRFHSFLETIGDWTYSIYLSHLFVLEFVSRLVTHLLPGLRNSSILVIDLLSLPVVLFVGYLSYTWFENPLKIALYKLAPASRQVASLSSSSLKTHSESITPPQVP